MTLMLTALAQYRKVPLSSFEAPTKTPALAGMFERFFPNGTTLTQALANARHLCRELETLTGANAEAEPDSRIDRMALGQG